MGSFFMFIAMAFSLAAFIGLLFPKLFHRFFKKSKPSRLKLFLWLTVASFLSLGIAAPFLPKVEQVSDRSNQSDHPEKNEHAYRVLSDDNKRTTKRTVEALLDYRISTDDLKRLAEEIKSQDGTKYDRTFISWRIDGEDDDRWALTNFDPSLTVQLIGLTAEKYTELVNLTPEIDGELLGSWVEPGLGASSHKVVGYKKNGKVYFDEFYVDGASKVHEYDEQEHDGQTRYKAKGDEVFYLVINKDGILESWTDTKKFNSLKPA